MPLITSPFDDPSTALEVVDGIDLSGRRAIVTGGASGIGVETVQALAHAGAQVTLAVRDVDAGAGVADDIRQSVRKADVAVAPLDLADLESIDAFVAAWHGPLHILVAEDTGRGSTGRLLMKTAEQGAATSVFVATSPLLQGVGGRYFEDCREAATVERLQGLHGVMPHAPDPDAARHLWDVSEALVAAARAT